MTLNEAVTQYLAVAERFERLMPLSGFALAPAELTAMIAAWEEDYHLSRHYELVPASYRDSGAQRYSISGIEYSGIIIHASISEILGHPPDSH